MPWWFYSGRGYRVLDRQLVVLLVEWLQRADLTVSNDSRVYRRVWLDRLAACQNSPNVRCHYKGLLGSSMHCILPYYLDGLYVYTLQQLGISSWSGKEYRPLLVAFVQGTD